MKSFSFLLIFVSLFLFSCQNQQSPKEKRTMQEPTKDGDCPEPPNPCNPCPGTHIGHSNVLTIKGNTGLAICCTNDACQQLAVNVYYDCKKLANSDDAKFLKVTASGYVLKNNILVDTINVLLKKDPNDNFSKSVAMTSSDFTPSTCDTCRTQLALTVDKSSQIFKSDNTYSLVLETKHGHSLDFPHGLDLHNQKMYEVQTTQARFMQPDSIARRKIMEETHLHRDTFPINFCIQNDNVKNFDN